MDRKTLVFLALTMVLAWGLLGGCQRPPWPEGPSGTVPPPPPPRAEVPEEPSQWPQDQTEKLNKERQTATLERFRQAYEKAGRPRLALIVNPTQRVAPAQAALSRPEPSPALLWRVKDGFLEPFLTAGAVIVDRPTAAPSSETKPPAATSSGPARVDGDVALELSAAEDQESPYGYEFLAEARDLKKGAILASSSSHRVLAKPKKVVTATPTPSGYELTEEEGQLPPARELGNNMAWDVMEGLTRNWGK